MEIKDIVVMPIAERAKRLVGDMPWVTMAMEIIGDGDKIPDLIAQIESSMRAAVFQAWYEQDHELDHKDTNDRRRGASKEEP